jgi:dCMP deaminase
MNRINWVDYFMGLAFLIKERSPDAQTKHGCVITDRKNRILGCGYNGFPRNMDDNSLPNTRPGKYQFIIHSEINAVSNCNVNLHTIDGGAICYTTGQICSECAKHLIQNNVKTWYIANRHGYTNPDQNQKEVFDRLVKDCDIGVYEVDLHIGWIQDSLEKYWGILPQTQIGIEKGTNLWVSTLNYLKQRLSNTKTTIQKIIKTH